MKAYREYGFPPVVIQLENAAEVEAMVTLLGVVASSQNKATDPHRDFYCNLRERIRDAMKDPD